METKKNGEKKINKKSTQRIEVVWVYCGAHLDVFI